MLIFSDVSIYQVKSSQVVETIEITRFAIDISYRIVSPAEISKFSIYAYINFLICHLAEFSRVMSRNREIFIETFTDFVIARKLGLRAILH